MNEKSIDKQSIYSLEKVKKVYSGQLEDVEILKAVELEIYSGETLAIVGASGSGKSTLLHILGMLDKQTDGTILLKGQDITKLSDAEKANLRNKELGFVFQFHHLMPEFNTLENVAMQAIVGGVRRKQAIDLAAEALEKVELSHRAYHNVTTLSGGERQRAAIARAILLRPSVLLADEPTGNLDEKTGALIANLLLDLNKKLGMTMVMVTHDHELASKMERSLELRSGELYEQTFN